MDGWMGMNERMDEWWEERHKYLFKKKKAHTQSNISSHAQFKITS
jgi:hypothetical protein